MALRWVALPRPLPGHAEEFERLWRRRFEDGAPFSPEESARFRAISVPAAATLKGPPAERDEAVPRQTVIAGNDPAVERASAGAAIATSAAAITAPATVAEGEPGPLVRRTVFPAEMIHGCAEVIGEALLADAAVNKRADALVAYGEALREAADRFARAHGLPEADLCAGAERGTPAALARTVATCARWCLFWGSRRHGCFADPDADH
jgi:hypothetical protein